MNLLRDRVVLISGGTQGLGAGIARRDQGAVRAGRRWCSSCRRWDWRVCGATEYDSCMKRITVSLPDELVEKIKRAAGGKRQVSSYVATALEDYQERETLDDILAAWREETPVPEEVQRQVEAELDDVGLTGLPGGGDRLAR